MDWGAVFAFTIVICFFSSYAIYSVINYVMCKKLDKKILEYCAQAKSRTKTMTDQERTRLWLWQVENQYCHDKEFIEDLLQRELGGQRDEYEWIAGYFYGVYGGHRLDNYWIPFVLVFSVNELLVYPIAEVDENHETLLMLGNKITIRIGLDELKFKLHKKDIKLKLKEIGFSIHVPDLYRWADFWPRYIDQRREFYLFCNYLKNTK